MALIVKVGADLRQYDREMKRLTRDTGSVEKKLTSIGSGLTKGITLPIAGLASVSAGLAIQFESDFAGVRKTVDATEDEFSKLSQGIRDMAKEIPASTTEINQVAAAAGQLGIEVPNILDFTETMIKLGTATEDLSAEEAAMQLAKFANITKMSQSDFDRLGSTITELGNNYATTEGSIVAMGMRLAGAGSQVGMSQSEIMGLATALSSVGIEAEAGGSAFSKVMVNMQLAAETGVGAFDELEGRGRQAGISMDTIFNAIRNGGKELKSVSGQMGMTSTELRRMYNEADKSANALEQFASVAGMTNVEFAKLFKNDPSKAISAFVKGLAEAEETGSSAIKVLEDMGIKEVRLRDALLRSASSADDFNLAIESGNKAWKENTALTKEAEERFGTTASKLTVAKNKIKDVGIELGNNLIPAVGAALDAADPLIKMLGDGARAFTEMDDSSKKMALGMLAVAASAGPILTITGKVIGSVGQIKAGWSILKGMGVAKSVGTTTTAIGKLGTASKLTAGSTTLLGSGFTAAAATAAPWVLGIGGVTLAVYALKKAYDDSRNTVESFGTELPKATAETLGTIEGDVASINGQFALLEEGSVISTGKMADSFETAGKALEQSLMDRVEGLDSLLKELGENVPEYFKDMVDEEKKKAQDAIDIIQENSESVAKIKENAAKNDRELTANEGKIIRDLMNQNVQSYAEVMIKDRETRKQVLDAMTGDLTQVTQDQAKEYLSTLAKQRTEANNQLNKSREDQKKILKEMGYDLNDEFAQKYLEAWDDINKTTVDGMDQQIAVLLEKYPELSEIVNLSSGEIVKANSDASKRVAMSNEYMLESMNTLTQGIQNTAGKNAKELKWMGDEATTSGKVWNSIILDEKTGNVKTNVREAVVEAASDSVTWNNIRFQIHEADLDSNAKLVIGEAAIANGWWDGMAWEDKDLILNNEASATVMKALQDTDRWQELSVEEKTALLYSNTEETMRETLVSMDLWDELEWEDKSALLETNTSETMVQAMVGDEIWQNLLWEEKQALLETNVTEATIKALEDNGKWQEMTWEEKLMLVESNTPEKVTESLLRLGVWNEYQPLIKSLGAENYDLLSKVAQSNESLAAYEKVSPSLKTLLADGPAKLTADECRKAMQEYAALNPKMKRLLANSDDAQRNTRIAKSQLDLYDQTNPGPKKLHVDANYQAAIDAKRAIDQVRDKNVRINVTYNGRSTGQSAIHSNAKGTDHFEGGLTEIHERGDEIVGLPQGSTILTAGLSRQAMQAYGQQKAKMDTMRIGQQINKNLMNRQSDSTNMSGIEKLLQENLAKKSVIVLDTGKLVGETYPAFNKMGGTRTTLDERWG